MRRIVLALWLALTTPALASDGVLEINQTCAVQTGCFPGDAAGFPVTIDRDQPGSYLLTGPLILDDPNATAIVVADSHVVLDLNGFAISGPTSCSGDPVQCTTTGTGKGIAVDPPTPPGVPGGVVVRNGIVRGMGSTGVDLGSEARIENVHAVSNGFDGISADALSIVAGCRVIRNGFYGILVGQQALVEGNTVAGNGQPAILALTGCVIRGNVVSHNAYAAIDTANAPSGGCLITDNSFTDNGPALFSTSDGYARNVFRNTSVSGGVQIDANLCGTTSCSSP
jgi:hypothetical protein